MPTTPDRLASLRVAAGSMKKSLLVFLSTPTDNICGRRLAMVAARLFGAPSEPPLPVLRTEDEIVAALEQGRAFEMPPGMTLVRASPQHPDHPDDEQNHSGAVEDDTGGDWVATTILDDVAVAVGALPIPVVDPFTEATDGEPDTHQGEGALVEAESPYREGDAGDDQTLVPVVASHEPAEIGHVVSPSDGMDPTVPGDRQTVDHSTRRVPPPDASFFAAPGVTVFDPATGGWRRDLVPETTPRRHGPMLARTFGEVEILFPVAAQPKIDGVRALLSRRGLVTRDGVAIVSLPEIAALGRDLPEGMTLDGELAIPGAPLEIIIAIVATKVPHPRRHEVVFHDFDAFFDVDLAGCDATSPFGDRFFAALLIVLSMKDAGGARIEAVPTARLDTVTQLEDHYRACLAAGFEGQIIRARGAPYVHGRCAALVKRKPWRDAEGAFIALTLGARTGLPRAAIVRDRETGEEITVAIPAMSAAERRALAANPPPSGSLVGYRWQASKSAHRRHCTLVRFYGPEGRY